MVNGPAFQHEGGIEAADIQMIEQALGQAGVVVVEIVFAAPGIEMPVAGRDLALLAQQESRADIAHP